MKIIRASVLAGLTLLLAMGSAQAVEVAINGGFETGDFTGWTQFPNDGTQAITGDASSGSFAAQLTQTTPNNSLIKNANIGIGQVAPGTIIDISFDAKGSTANGGVIFAEVFSELDGGGTSAGEILGGGPLAVTSDYQNFMFSTVAGPDVSGGVTFQIGAVCGADPGCSSEVFVDNVSVNVVPIPAAAWLFGSALGLLGWIRRKAS